MKLNVPIRTLGQILGRWLLITGLLVLLVTGLDRVKSAPWLQELTRKDGLFASLLFDRIDSLARVVG